jgi:hypothetical protein
MKEITQVQFDRKVKAHALYQKTNRDWRIETKGQMFYLEFMSVGSGIEIENVTLNNAGMDFCKINADFVGADLSGMEFEHCIFNCGDFTNCNLSGARFIDCSLSHVIFKDCKWDGETTFRGSTLDNCYYEGNYPPMGAFRYTLIRDCIGLPKYVQISNVGSRNDNLIYDYDNDIMYVGCQEITMAQFVEAVKDRHTGRYAYGNSGKALIEYNNIISMLTTLRQYYDENNLLNNKQEKTAEFDDETEDETAEVEEIEDDYEDEDEGFIAGCDCRNCRPDLYNEDGSRKSVVADPCPDYEEEKEEVKEDGENGNNSETR